MSCAKLLAVLAALGSVASINKPVYKIQLTQKGYTQFIQYDVETPPIREFTFCAWVKFYEFTKDQSIFTYLVDSNRRVACMWLDSGGKNLKVMFNGKIFTGVPVDLEEHSWHLICLSFQSDFGAFAVYLDSRLVTCQSAQGLQLYVIPAGGKVILGYGMTNKGDSSGLEGEIYGANMILTSTIERNYTLRNHPSFAQKAFQKNKIRSATGEDYIVLNNALREKTPNGSIKSRNHQKLNKTKNFIKIKTPHSFVQHDVGHQTQVIPLQYSIPESHEKEIIDLVLNPDHQGVSGTPKKYIKDNLVKDQKKYGREQSSSSTQDSQVLSEFEKPPAPNSERTYYDTSTLGFEKEPMYASVYNFIDKTPPSSTHTHKETSMETISKERLKYGRGQTSSSTKDFQVLSEFEKPPAPNSERTYYDTSTLGFEKEPMYESVYNFIDKTPPPSKHAHKDISMETISEFELPPPPLKDTKVYGQWTSSKFAGSVLNYLKSINFQRPLFKDKKIPTTILLPKVSDSFPYASNFQSRVVQPPKNLPKKHVLPENYAYRQKRSAPEINVKILEDDLRKSILQSHAESNPINVEISNRGQTRIAKHNNDEWTQFSSTSDLPDSFNGLPFLKSVEYFTGEYYNNNLSETVANSTDMYEKSFLGDNKWHNLKTYNRKYSPRPNQFDDENSLDHDDSETNNNHQTVINVKYKPEINKIVPGYNLEDRKLISEGRQLAMSVSHESDNNNKGKLSLLKYNHGFLPGHHHEAKTRDAKLSNHAVSNKPDFNKHVKIGNALNEKNVIGYNDQQRKHSFLGGDDSIPDIPRYRSDIDKVNHNVPPSLKPMVCKGVEMLDHLLYVHLDGSIDMSQIISPIKKKNTAIEFIIENYKKCSLDDSPFEKNYLLLINWNKTPVKLFGGADTKRTKDLCGFFK